MQKVRASVLVAKSAILLLLAVSIFGQLVVIPISAFSLESTFVEYQGDAAAIIVILSSGFLCAQVTLVTTSMLLTRIARGTLLTKASGKLVSILMFSLAAIGVVCGSLFAWLVSQNTLPPIVNIGLVVGMLVSITGTMIIRALKAVLMDAIDSKAELEGVI